MNINAIYKKAVNNGYEVKTVTTNSGKYAIIVEGWNTPDFYNCIHSIYRKCNVHINFHYATQSACIMDNADYEADRAYNTAKTDLINVFWQSIHNGQNQQEAKANQYEYAIKHNIVDVFNRIYA